MTDPNARFLSPAAAFAAQQAEETRLLMEIEKAFAKLAASARAGAANYSLSQLSLREQWEKDITRALEACGISGPAGESLRKALSDADAGGEVYELADSVMKFGLTVGASTQEVGQALSELLGDPSLTAAGGLKNLWGKVKEWLPSRSRRWRSKARTLTRTAYTGYSGLLAQTWLQANGHSSKRWVTRHDDAVRPTHRAADGQTVPVEARFLVGGALLAYPGDRSGPIQETVNCRCVIVSGD